MAAGSVACYHRCFHLGGLRWGPAVDRGVAGVKRLAGGGGVVAGGEEVRVHPQGDAWVGVSKLAADEYDMEAAGDEKGGVGVAQAVEGQLARRMKVGGLDGSAEGFADRGRSSVRAHAGSQRRSPRALCGDWQANAGATCSQVRVPGLPRAWRPRSLAGRAVGGG